MSHSQWEKKKYKKAASEGKTSKLFSKIVRVITMEAKKSGGNVKKEMIMFDSKKNNYYYELYN